MFIVRIIIKITAYPGKFRFFNQCNKPDFGKTLSNTTPSIVAQIRIDASGPIFPIRSKV
mgnify:CR=1 FL=1